ncbi:MAG: hypothetical protein R3D63_04020 [Paracoccaceae bacterium]
MPPAAVAPRPAGSVTPLPSPRAPAPGPAPGAPAVAAPTQPAFGPPASASRLRGRHVGVLSMFLLVVLLPTLVSAWYLYARAADQYASTLGFSVHREDMSSAVSLISGLSSLSGSSSADTDVIYSYIYSQDLVAAIDAEIDLRRIWSKPAGDVVFAFDPAGSIEDLVDYWQEMVTVTYDSRTRLIDIRVRAFDPVDAQRIAQTIFDRSTEVVNRMNDIAVEDSVRFTQRELERSRETLVEARQALTAYRNRYQIVDPAADVAAQMTIVGSLQQQLAEAMIDLDLLKANSMAEDPRVTSLERRIKVIEDRIKIERTKLGLGYAGAEGGTIADAVAEYERLAVDQEYAETAYNAARAAHEVALADAQRQSRYLAAHILPTLAETARYPERPLMLGLIAGFLAMIWAVGALIFYSIRDRR